MSLNRILEEFRASAIPDELTAANVSWIDGEEAVQILAEHAIAQAQKVTSYLTKAAARYLKFYEYAAAGGWVAYGCDPTGHQSGEVAYFKPVNPRKEFKNGRLKPIKYDTPSKSQALPIVPWVDEATAQSIYQRYNVQPEPGETFWEVVWRCNLPVAVTEGLKKSLGLVAHGLPAIAIRGISTWHPKGTNELHEAIAHFATEGRKFYIVLDQDEKPQTQKDIRTQTLKLGTVLEFKNCKVSVLVWSQSFGKGIDDALYSKGEAAKSWFDELVENAPSLKDYKRFGALAAALETIARLNRLSFPIERETSGEYLPDLPPIKKGAIHAVLAAMCSGKTTQIGKYWVKIARAQGWFVLVLAPLNGLGRQTAQNWGLPHIHDYDTSQTGQTALWAEASHSNGIVMCPDSLHRLQNWIFNRPVLLVLDEANQTIEHLTTGDTLGDRIGDIQERFGAIACHAAATGAIILSEDGLPDRAVKFIQAVTDCQDVRVFRHNREAQPWNCTVFSGNAVSGFRAKLLAAIARGEKILFTTSSQKEAERLEQAIARLVKGCKVVRIDSETNQQGMFNGFFQSPDQWLRANQPDILILSPSAKSGVSIEGAVSVMDAYFSAVWGYFPALATDTHVQLLGRYRPAVPRFIYVPEFILGSGDESLFNPRAVRRRFESNARAFSNLYSLVEALEDAGDRVEPLIRLENAVMDYLAEAKAVSGCQKSIARTALIRRLEKAGHIIQESGLEKDSEFSNLWEEIQEEIWRKDAQAMASIVIEETHTLEWAYKTLDSLEASLESRMRAQKVILRHEFPGVLFDDSHECYEALFKDYGSMRRGVQLQARAENLEAAKEGDRHAVERVLNGRIRAIHRLPRSVAKAWLIAKTGILDLLNGQPYRESDPRVQAIKASALKYAKEIHYWLGNQIKETQTGIEICNKLLRKLGLDRKQIARPGRRGEQERVWQVEGLDNPVRIRLLEALRRKLSESVSTISNKDQKPHIEIVDTAQPKPINGMLVRWGRSLSPWIVERVEGDRAHIKLQLTGYAQTVLISELREIQEEATAS